MKDQPLEFVQTMRNERRASDYEPCPHGEKVEARLTSVENSMVEILDILTMGKAFFRFAGYFGKFVQLVIIVATPLIAIWAAMKGPK